MKVVVTIPTYNEADNVGVLIPQILELSPDYHVLVIDDKSPDGTGDVVRRLAEGSDRVHLLEREGPRGRGRAGVDGFVRALDMGADAVVEMDADLSHQPRHIPELCARIGAADVVIGSRMVAGGREEGRGIARRIITVLANAYIRVVLGLAVRDATSGFRAFSRQALARLDLRAMRSTGPSIVQEVLFACVLQGCRVEEVPIVFVDRVAGRSTFTPAVMKQSLVNVLELRRRRAELGKRRPDAAVQGRETK
ncbi:MAG: polyprenol monophosphomannose synthase [Acidobacteriota bacterium]